MVGEDSGRRGFVRKMVGLVAAGGIASVLFGRQVEQVSAASLGDVWFDDGAGGHSTDIFGAFHWDATNQRLGIGTAASPTQALDVNGQINATNILDSALGGGVVPFAGTGGLLSNSGLYWDNASNRLGVGTSSPSAKLHVSGTTPNILMGDSANTITSGVVGATISGGGIAGGANSVTDHYGVVSGGQSNQAGNGTVDLSDAAWATVGGGYENTASGYRSTVGGGGGNTASTYGSTVGGGYDNTSSGDWATVAGGQSNQATGGYSTVAGGYNNAASGASTVGGGVSNQASGNDSTVGGGRSNQVSGDYSMVGGGGSNTACGSYSMVPGGASNVAKGDYSFAAGRRAKAQSSGGTAHAGAFVWADQTDADFNSVAPNEFAVRCTGGARFVTAIDGGGTPAATTLIDPSGRLGVGTSAPSFNVHVLGLVDPASVTVDGVGMVGPNFMFRRARGTPNAMTPVQAGDGLLFLVAKGYGATGFSATGRANISMYAAENWSDTAQGTYICFRTTQAGTATQTEKMRITDVGDVIPPADDTGNIGLDTRRWHRVRANIIQNGDLLFENGYRVTEDTQSGLRFLNEDGEQIAKLDHEGNFHIKGRFVEDL